jgi:hypothetical protein
MQDFLAMVQICFVLASKKKEPMGNAVPHLLLRQQGKILLVIFYV